MLDLKFPSSMACNLLDSRMRRFFAKESSKWQETGPWRWPSVCYTMEHKLAFLEREHYLTGHYSLRGIFHDWEKPFLFLCPWLSEGKIQKIHRQFSPHHIGSPKISKIEHLIETYVDWDCAAITKPDKPLNAFETLVHYYVDAIGIMLPVCLAFGIEAVRPDIIVRPDRKLGQKPELNREVYAKVIQTLQLIISGLPQSYAGWLAIEWQYQKHKAITDFSPAEIFALALGKQQDNLAIDLNVATINELLQQALERMRSRNCFIPSPHEKPLHDYKRVKSCPFAWQ